MLQVSYLYFWMFLLPLDNNFLLIKHPLVEYVAKNLGWLSERHVGDEKSLKKEYTWHNEFGACVLQTLNSLCMKVIKQGYFRGF